MIHLQVKIAVEVEFIGEQIGGQGDDKQDKDQQPAGERVMTSRIKINSQRGILKDGFGTDIFAIQ